MRLVAKEKFWCFLLTVSLFSGPIASAQESPVWNRSALRDSIILLLEHYRDLHNNLGVSADPSVEREFVNLFSNFKVQVVSDLEDQAKPSVISIEDYIAKVYDLFPQGLTVDFLFSRMMVEQPKYDRNSRYIMRVRVTRTLSGINNGKVFSSSRRMIYQIGFYNNSTAPGSFAIYGIEPAPKSQGILSASVSPSFTGLVNSTLESDGRLGIERDPGISGGFYYSWFFSPHWGIGAGGQFSQYSGRLTLDKIDPLNGFDPNIKDLSIENGAWFAEVPVFLAWRTGFFGHWVFRTEVGPFLGYRIFEKMSSSALNSNTGAAMSDVISDADWLTRIGRINLGIQGSMSICYRLNNSLGFFIGGGIRQGITRLNKNTRADFNSSRYLGQYNPVWSAPGKTLSQAFSVNLGATFSFNKDQN